MVSNRLISSASVWCQDMFFYPVEFSVIFPFCPQLAFISGERSLAHFHVKPDNKAKPVRASSPDACNWFCNLYCWYVAWKGDSRVPIPSPGGSLPHAVTLSRASPLEGSSGILLCPTCQVPTRLGAFPWTAAHCPGSGRPLSAATHPFPWGINSHFMYLGVQRAANLSCIGGFICSDALSDGGDRGDWGVGFSFPLF